MFRVCQIFCASIALTIGATAAEFSFIVKNVRNEPVTDAVISLIPSDTALTLPPPTSAELAQEDQEYSAYVTVVQAGGTVVFPNKDTVQHHVYSLSKTKKFELPLYNPGSAESFVFDVPGVVTLGCNIHDWMLAYLLVVPTPYFSKSDGEGEGKISAPAGLYRLELWHPRLPATVKEDITLADSPSTRQAFTVTTKPDRRVRRGAESKSGGYR